MKQALTLLFLLIGTHVMAQISITTDRFEFCALDPINFEEKDCRMIEDYSLIEINANETMLTQTTKDFKTVYFIKNNEYDYEDKIYTLGVVSENGLKGVFFINSDKRVVGFLLGEDDERFIIRYSIKSIF